MSLKDIRSGLRTFLLANGAVAALVSTRVYPIKIPQGEKNASLVYNEISGQGDHHMQGASGLVSVRMQIGAWAQTADAAHALFLTTKYALDGYGGLMGSVDVQGVFIESWRDIDDTTANLRGKVADYIIWYAER
jgi:hypothetical protein